MSRIQRVLAMMASGGALAILAASAVSSQVPKEHLDRMAGRWPRVSAPEGTVPIPVVVPRNSDRNATSLSVCMYAGGPPHTYQVLRGRTCWDGADHCTVFVAVPLADDILIGEYDARNPPVLSKGEGTCTEPSRRPTGVLTGASIRRPTD